MKPLARLLWRVGSGLFGWLCLVIGLAVLSSMPVLNFLAFGYLLEAAGRTAHSGRWRDGVFGVRQAGIAGSAALAGWLLVLPIRFISSLRTDATLLGESSAGSMRFTSNLLTWLSAGLAVAVVLGLLSAGSRYAGQETQDAPRRFFARARDGLLAFIVDLRLPKLFWLGLRGWTGSFLWIIVPALLLIAASRIANNAAILVAAAGIVLLVPVSTGLPLVQARFAASGRWGDLFDWSRHRLLFRQAPWACFVAVLATLAAALPLYLLRIELPPDDLAWLPGLFFIVLLWPARILTGWAVYRAERLPHARPQGALRNFVPRFLILTAGLAYGIGIWTMQYLDWHGAASFLEQHAFLLPSLLGETPRFPSW